MTADPTADLRRALIEEGVVDDALLGVLDAGDPVWDTTALQAEFTVEGFLAPFVIVRRKADGVRGTLTFTHSPRYYFDFQEGS